jgi:replicative DNA helicase
VKKIETLVLSHLIYNEPYLRKVIPFVLDEYFKDPNERKVMVKIRDFVEEYNALPTIEALQIQFQNDRSLAEDEFDGINEVLTSLENTDTPQEWLLDETEKFCKDRALYNAIVESIQIIDGKSKTLSTGAIPAILQDALSVCFDSNIGHDYLVDSDDRFDFYNRAEEKIPCDLALFNKVMNGGVPKKTLNVIMMGIGVGKTLTMTHLAGAYLAAGLKVLYITMEMAQERIAERIDANLLNVSLEELKDLPKTLFQSKMDKLKNRTEGKLIIKEYPSGSAHVGHFRALLSDLALKKEFIPDIIFIDYLGICASSRFKAGGEANMYSYVKSIAEEIRGLAQEKNVPIWTAAQVNRSGFSNTEVEMTDVAESFGLPATAGKTRSDYVQTA